jgi:hypothetical protein
MHTNYLTYLTSMGVGKHRLLLLLLLLLLGNSVDCIWTFCSYSYLGYSTYVEDSLEQSGVKSGGPGI